MTWVVDLCRDWKRIATTTAAVFSGVSRRNASGDFTLDVAPAGVDGSSYPQPLFADKVLPFDPRDVDSIRVVGEGHVLFTGVLAGEGGGFRLMADANGERWRWTGVDMWSVLNDRLAFPTPSTTAPWADDDDIRTGQASSVIAAFIDANCGPGALSARRFPGLVVEDQTVGVSSTWSARLQPLGDLIGRIAQDGGTEVFPSVGFDGVFRILITGARDFSEALVLSDQGDLKTSEILFEPASATWTVTGGSATGSSRVFRVADTGTTGLDRKEQFSDLSSATSTAEVQADANTQNALGAAAYAIMTELTDTQAAAALQFGLRLGDALTVIVKERRYTVTIESLSIEISPERQVVRPVLGTAIPNDLTRLLRRLAWLERRNASTVA